MVNLNELFQRKWQEQSFKDKLYWMRSLFAVVGAIISTLIRPVFLSPYADSVFMSIQHPALISAVTGVLITIGLSTLVSYFYLKIKPGMIGGWQTYLTTGLLTALFLWLTVWTILYNVILYLTPSISITQLFRYIGILPPF
jgi:hypothetical protein